MIETTKKTSVSAFMADNTLLCSLRMNNLNMYYAYSTEK